MFVSHLARTSDCLRLFPVYRLNSSFMVILIKPRLFCLGLFFRTMLRSLACHYGSSHASPTVHHRLLLAWRYFYYFARLVQLDWSQLHRIENEQQWSQWCSHIFQRCTTLLQQNYPPKGTCKANDRRRWQLWLSFPVRYHRSSVYDIRPTIWRRQPCRADSCLWRTNVVLFRCFPSWIRAVH